MYTLKEIARRGTLAGAAFGMAVAAIVPAVFPSGLAFADALNPLTERSLTLSSSAPGWSKTDGSGNSTYAPPNSGANGQMTGNYFDFKVSSAENIKTLSFQYCTTSAGNCIIPGNNTTRGTDTATTSDLNAEFPATPTNHEIAGGDFNTVIDSATGAVKAVPGYTNRNPKYIASGLNNDAAEAAKAVTGSYIVMTNNGGTWTQSSGWTVTSKTVQVAGGTGATKNYIILTKAAGVNVTAGQQMKVLFFANGQTYNAATGVYSGGDYITNPGASAFFVKINTYKNEFVEATPGANQMLLADMQPLSDANVIDGGVTVANVMNQSIQITTKVLETMEFSVGTVDPNTLDSTNGTTSVPSDLQKAKGVAATSPANATKHGVCDIIQTKLDKSAAGPENVLQLGNQDGESSLSTQEAYATHSYWRLSSNSSAGATVYYSGHTLSNTSGDEIKPIGTTAAISAPGSEQFGLAIATANGNTDSSVNYVQDRQAGPPAKLWENGADNDKLGLHASMSEVTSISYHSPRLAPLVAFNGTGGAMGGPTNYSNGAGRINGDDSLDLNGVAFGGGSYDTTDAQFAFDPLSDTVPAAIATENNQVVDCVTAKMRYIGNMAATTPAGIYTTKINYIAAPQY